MTATPPKRRAVNSTLPAPTKRIPQISAKRAAAHPELVRIGRTVLPCTALPAKRHLALELVPVGKTYLLTSAPPAPRVSDIKKSPKWIRRRNPKNQPKNFARAYHSLERVRFVKSLPCSACRVEGWSENAHLLGNDGARRKGPYDSIGPLCGDRFTTVGCHKTYDERRGDFDALYPTFDAVAVCAHTEVLWQELAESLRAFAGHQDGRGERAS